MIRIFLKFDTISSLAQLQPRHFPRVIRASRARAPGVCKSLT
jgi:hypothetical protein